LGKKRVGKKVNWKKGDSGSGECCPNADRRLETETQTETQIQTQIATQIATKIATQIIAEKDQ